MGKRIILKLKKCAQISVLCFLAIIIDIGLLHAGLIFENNGQEQCELTDNGNFSGATIVEQSTETPTVNAFIFDYQTQTALWVENDHTVHFPDVFENRIRTFPGTGLIIDNSQGEQVAEILSNGKLYIQGDKRQIAGGVSYADATGVFVWNSNIEEFELKYQNIVSPVDLEGRIDYETRVGDYYIKNHLGSVCAAINENGDLFETVKYHTLGSQEYSMRSPGKVRETFTGKEYDEEGTENGAPGIQLYYFGKRYYDPDVGVWTSTDPAGQFYNPYAYSSNPILVIDENGDVFWLIPVLAYAIGYVMYGITNKDWGFDAVKTGFWSALASIAVTEAPITLLVIYTGGQGLVTMISNQEWNPQQFFLGAVEGYVDFLNTASLGLLSTPSAQISGLFKGLAYCEAYGVHGEGKRIAIDEAIEMNKAFGRFPLQGMAVKWAADAMWGWNSDRNLIGKENRYKFARGKRLYMEAYRSKNNKEYNEFIEKYPELAGKFDWEIGSQGAWYPQFGHAFFGSFFSHKLWHDLFETYGEPWESWNWQDYVDDFGLTVWWGHYFISEVLP